MYDELIDIGPTERRHIQDLEKAWASYGPALRQRSSLDGGMQWKVVNGAAYLARYRQDPETGKKKFTSLGRRAPETERTYDDFMKRREAAKQTVTSMRDGILTAGRVAKAYRLAHVPTKMARILRALWARPLAEDVTVFGGTALRAYEFAAGALVPGDLADEDRLILLALRSDLNHQDIAGVYKAVTLDHAAITKERYRTIFRTSGWPPVEVWHPDQLLSALKTRGRLKCSRKRSVPSRTSVSRSRGMPNPSNFGRSIPGPTRSPHTFCHRSRTTCGPDGQDALQPSCRA